MKQTRIIVKVSATESFLLAVRKILCNSRTAVHDSVVPNNNFRAEFKPEVEQWSINTTPVRVKRIR